MKVEWMQKRKQIVNLDAILDGVQELFLLCGFNELQQTINLIKKHKIF